MRNIECERNREREQKHISLYDDVDHDGGGAYYEENIYFPSNIPRRDHREETG